MEDGEAGESGERASSSFRRMLHVPLTVADECARILDGLLLDFAPKLADCPSGLVGVELEPWRKVGTRIDCTDTLRLRTGIGDK